MQEQNHRHSVPVPPVPPAPPQHSRPPQPPVIPQQSQQPQPPQSQQYRQPQQPGQPTQVASGGQEWDIWDYIRDYPTYYFEYRLIFFVTVFVLVVCVLGWIASVVAVVVANSASLVACVIAGGGVTLIWLIIAAFTLFKFFRRREDIKIKIRNETNTRHYNARQ